jgi:DNA-binding NtrC family response regulator
VISVLVIDDDESVRTSLKFHLEDCGFTTYSTETAEDALELLENTSVDTAIVDLRLPGIDGEEFIRLATARWPGMRFIIYTGSPVMHVPAEILSASSVSPELFLKPISALTKLSDEVRRISGTS